MLYYEILSQPFKVLGRVPGPAENKLQSKIDIPDPQLSLIWSAICKTASHHLFILETKFADLPFLFYIILFPEEAKMDYSGFHCQCSIPVLVVVEMGQNPHGSWEMVSE